MVQPIQKVTGFRAPAEAKPVARAPAPPEFVRSRLPAVPAPISSSVRASQDAVAKDIQGLFNRVNPGPTNSVHSTCVKLHDGEVTVSGRSNDLTIKGKNFELKIKEGKFAGADKGIGELGSYREMLLLKNGLLESLNLRGVWPPKLDELDAV
jgi:hypothetical protein